MPRKGYWIECIPVNRNTVKDAGADLYSASIGSFPELSAYAPSPDQAIQKLSEKLRKIKHQYELTGRNLPGVENPVRPPQRLRFVQGWISVYIDLEDLSGGNITCQ